MSPFLLQSLLNITHLTLRGFSLILQSNENVWHTVPAGAPAKSVACRVSQRENAESEFWLWLPQSQRSGSTLCETFQARGKKGGKKVTLMWTFNWKACRREQTTLAAAGTTSCLKFSSFPTLMRKMGFITSTALQQWLKQPRGGPDYWQSRQEGGEERVTERVVPLLPPPRPLSIDHLPSLQALLIPH